MLRANGHETVHKIEVGEKAEGGYNCENKIAKLIFEDGTDRQILIKGRDGCGNARKNLFWKEGLVYTEIMNSPNWKSKINTPFLYLAIADKFSGGQLVVIEFLEDCKILKYIFQCQALGKTLAETAGEGVTERQVLEAVIDNIADLHIQYWNDEKALEWASDKGWHA